MYLLKNNFYFVHKHDNLSIIYKTIWNSFGV